MEDDYFFKILMIMSVYIQQRLKTKVKSNLGSF